MKLLLGRLSPRRAVGVYVGDDEIAVSQVAGTPLGPVEIHRHRETYQPNELPGVLQRVLQPLVGKRRRRRRLVAFALPLLRVFFSTRPLKATNVEFSPKVLLHEVLRSPNSNVEEMAIDMMQASPGKRPIVSLVSCRKKYLSNLLGNIQDCGIRPFRIEPTTCALLRAAEEQHRAPRKAKTVLRLFLGKEDGLAVLSVSGWPLVPRALKVAESDVTTAVVSIVRTLETLGKLCGTDSALDAVLVHGGAELRGQADLEALEQQIGVPIQWHDGPALDNSSIALGCALGCLKPNGQAFDLARSIKPRETLWELFPWGEVALQVAVVICLGLFLLNYSQELSETYAAVRAETARRDWLAPLAEQQLGKEKMELEQRVDAIRKFLSTRIVWTAYTHDIPSRLPADATLNSFQGLCELEKKGKKDEKSTKPKKSLTMRIGAPIAKDGSAPKEIDGFLDSLRGHSLLKRDFPLVELADIKWFQPFAGAQASAFFTVVCLPKPTSSGGPPSAGAEKADKQKEH
jgi:hypothetical protein